MKPSIICGAVVATALMAVSHVGSAEVAGLKSDAECKKKVSTLADLTTTLANLSPQAAADYFDANNNRFIFCMDTNTNPTIKNSVTVFNPITIANNTAYPIIINGLAIDNSKKDGTGNYIVPTNTSLLTIASGTGEIALQNLKADNLRAPILLQGKTTFLDSTVSCDAANTAPGITVSSNNNTFRKVNINECSGGLGVTGSFNNFYEVAINKTAADESQTGGWGITSTGTANSFFALAIQNYKGGAMLWGNNNKILAMQVAEGTVGAFKNAEGAWGLPSVIRGWTKEVQGVDGKPVQEPVNNSIGVYFKASGTLDYSTVDGVAFGVGVEANNIKIRNNLALGGTQGAVVIGHDPITDKAFQPVVVSKNTFTTKETIKYVEKSDTDVHRLLGVEWMGKQVSETDPTKAKGIVGKLLDQSNNSTVVEMTLKKDEETHFKYTQNCDVKIAAKRIEIVFDENGVKTSKYIEPKEKLFECTFVDENKNPIELESADRARITSNSPTISLMTENVEIAKLGVFPTTPGQVGVIMDSGGLFDGTQVAGLGGGDAATLDVPNAPQSPAGGGGSSAPPVDSPDVGENSGGSNMVNGVTGLGGEVPTVVGGGSDMAGAPGLVGSLTSGGGCSLTTQGTPSPHALSLLVIIATITITAAYLARRRCR